MNAEEDDATRLCNSLPGCKGPGKKVTSQWMTTEKFVRLQQGALINCAGIQNVKHLWQCVESLSSTCAGPAAVSCKGNKHCAMPTRSVQHVARPKRL